MSARRSVVLALAGTILALGLFVRLTSLLIEGVRLVAPAVSTQPAPSGQTRLDDLPLPVQVAVSQRLGEHQTRYHFEEAGGGFTGRAATGAPIAIDSDRVTIGSDGAGWTLRAERLGRAGAGVTLAAGPMRQTAPNRVEAARTGLTEWFVNGPAGLQQGWTIAERPSGAGALELELASSRQVAVAPDGRSVTASGYRYGGLLAYDASGKDLQARFVGRAGGVAVSVDDAQAVYPVVIDPFLTETRLTASDGAANDYLGHSVAVSADGGTVVAGAYGDDGLRR